MNEDLNEIKNSLKKIVLNEIPIKKSYLNKWDNG